MTILVVDDRRIFTKLPDDVLYARTIEAGLEVLRSGRPLAQLWLDHDLGEIDGRPVDVRPLVTAIEERAFHGYPYDIGRVVIHSSNPEGARWIESGLSRYYPVRRVSDAWYL